MNPGGTSIALRDWHENDLQFLMRLRNDVSLQALLLATAQGSDEAAVRTWLLKRTSGPGRLFRVIADDPTNDPMGYLQADCVDETTGVWSFGICLDAAHQGKGNGAAALKALEDLLAEKFGAQHLQLEVGLDNERAINCYTKLGYARTEAPTWQVTVCGEQRDVISMVKSLIPRGQDA
ncbi:MAG: GNAT family protein [Hoeflea sp.]|uniref:GNAT family N-acetyltransferase n=1 Tax=Hoeflea sp. TaxID=1940281 RepID=UPI0032ED3F24